MSQDFVEGIIRRSNRNLLIICLLGILIVAGVAVISANYLHNFFNGPFSINSEALLAINDLSQQREYWVTVRGADSLDTGYQYVREQTGGGETVEANYPALVIGDSLLLVKTAGDPSGREYTGALIPISAEVQQEIIDDIGQDYPKVRDAFLPYMLDTTDFRGNGYVGLIIGGVVALLCLWGLTRAILRSGDLQRHPIMRSLGRFGEPQMMAQQINGEVMHQHPTVGKLHFTQNWLLLASSASLKATRLNDVMWAYMKVTQHRTNGIPTGKTHAALVWDRYGKCITISGREKTVRETLEGILNRAPWAIGGYAADIEKTWKSNRAGFIGAVDQRRASVPTGQ